VDDFTTQDMGLALTAVAELALLLLSAEKWVTGTRAMKLRAAYELLGELLEAANDRIEK